MAGTPTALSSSERAIALCERGIYEPSYGSEPIDLLARGMAESATGDLETAKDLLSRAYWSLTGEWKDKAGVQLSVAYWRGGEKSEAWALLETLPSGFEVLLTQAIIQTDTDPQLALETLQQAEAYDVSRYMRGRFHNQRGMCLRLLGRPAEAREEYEAALYFFADCPLRALVENNLAGVVDTKESHQIVDRAIAVLSGPHLGQAYERKAQALFSEAKFDSSLQYATWAVDLLDAANRRTWLIDALFTRAKVLECTGRFGEAVTDLARAYDLAEFLGDADLQIRCAKDAQRVTHLASKFYHTRSVSIALSCSDSLNSAARKLGISRPTLQDFMRVHGLNFQGRPRKSIIKRS
jgi:tetratricopeptide (TPR) repeat protein